MPIRVVVADDADEVRSAEIDVLLADGRFDVVAAVGTADEAVAATLEHRPDVVLLDIRMPGGGLQAARTIRSHRLRTVVTVISAQMDAALLADLLHADVRGVLMKGNVADTLPGLLARCHAGEVLLSTSVAARGLDLFARRHHESGS